MTTSRYWLPVARLRALARAGHTLEEVALANELATGWKPSRPTVSKKLAEIGEPPRYGSRKDLIPWTLQKGHETSRYRFWLAAESKRRAGLKLTPSDERAIDLMYNVLNGRGAEMVIAYCEHHGLYLDLKRDDDTDIIRVDSDSNDSTDDGNSHDGETA